MTRACASLILGGLGMFLWSPLPFDMVGGVMIVAGVVLSIEAEYPLDRRRPR